MTNEMRTTSPASATPVTPTTSAWGYAASRIGAPRSWLHWAGSLAGITVIELVFTDWSPARAVLSAIGFLFAIELLEFVRRLLSGPPVGETGKDPW